MVGRWGMSDAIGPIAVTDGRQDGALLPGAMPASEPTQELVDKEVRRIVEGAERDVIQLLERSTASSSTPSPTRCSTARRSTSRRPTRSPVSRCGRRSGRGGQGGRGGPGQVLDSPTSRAETSTRGVLLRVVLPRPGRPRTSARTCSTTSATPAASSIGLAVVRNSAPSAAEADLGRLHRVPVPVAVRAADRQQQEPGRRPRRTRSGGSSRGLDLRPVTVRSTSVVS